MTNSTLEYPTELLQSLSDLRLTQGRSAYHELEEGFWMVTTRQRPDQRLEHLVTLSLGPHLRPAARNLAWGLEPKTAAGGFSWCGRTDHRGQFRVADLTPGQHRLKYVLEVRGEEDVQLLEQLADPWGWEALDEAQHDASLPVGLRRLAVAALQEHRAEVAWITDLLTAYREGGPEATTAVVARAPRHAPSARQAAPSGALSGSSAPPARPSTEARSTKTGQTVPPLEDVPDLTRIEPIGHVLEIRQPAERVPFGVARILAHGASRKQLLGTRLVCLPEYETAHGTVFCSASVRCDEILGAERDPLEIHYYLHPAQPKTLAYFQLAEVEQLLAQPSVASDMKLKTKIECLRNLLKR
ncbi:MAG: hypothetical protein NTY19_05895 [Planctomycetota bacterium]|nr:hypothetical protein [Planctomycetota bacterium]